MWTGLRVAYAATSVPCPTARLPLSKHLRHIPLPCSPGVSSGHRSQIRRRCGTRTRRFINAEADGTDMLTVWPAATDATIENGCLIVERGSHRGEMTLHCPGKIFPAEIYIPDTIIDDDRVLPLEVRAGGAVLLHKMTEHGSPDNHSDDIRWSFDIRYQPIGQPTGRSAFPGFVARSSSHPEQIVNDPDEWAYLWWEARAGSPTGRCRCASTPGGKPTPGNLSAPEPVRSSAPREGSDARDRTPERRVWKASRPAGRRHAPVKRDGPYSGSRCLFTSRDRRIKERRLC